jgi:hypothetical protein
MKRTLLLAAPLGALGLIVCSMLLLGTADAPPRGVYRAAVEAALERRGVEHQGVRVVDGCAPTYQLCQRYQGQVTVMLGLPVHGQISCRWRWAGCALSIPALGMRDEPLRGAAMWLTRQDVNQIVGDLTVELRRTVRQAAGEGSTEVRSRWAMPEE